MTTHGYLLNVNECDFVYVEVDHPEYYDSAYINCMFTKVDVDLPAYTHLVYQVNDHTFKFLKLYHTNFGTRACLLNMISDHYQIALLKKFISFKFLEEGEYVVANRGFGTHFRTFVTERAPEVNYPVALGEDSFNQMVYDPSNGLYDELIYHSDESSKLMKQNIQFRGNENIEQEWRVLISSAHDDSWVLEEQLCWCLDLLPDARPECDWPEDARPTYVPPTSVQDACGTYRTAVNIGVLDELAATETRKTSAVHTALTAEKSKYSHHDDGFIAPRVRFAVNDKGLLYPSADGHFFVTNEGRLDTGRYHSDILRIGPNQTLWFPAELLPLNTLMDVDMLRVNGSCYVSELDSSMFNQNAKSRADIHAHWSRSDRVQPESKERAAFVKRDFDRNSVERCNMFHGKIGTRIGEPGNEHDE